jgi:hypothetical protein
LAPTVSATASKMVEYRAGRNRTSNPWRARNADRAPVRACHTAELGGDLGSVGAYSAWLAGRRHLTTDQRSPYAALTLSDVSSSQGGSANPGMRVDTPATQQDGHGARSARSTVVGRAGGVTAIVCGSGNAVGLIAAMTVAAAAVRTRRRIRCAFLRSCQCRLNDITPPQRGMQLFRAPGLGTPPAPAPCTPAAPPASDTSSRSPSS